MEMDVYNQAQNILRFGILNVFEILARFAFFKFLFVYSVLSFRHFAGHKNRPNYIIIKPMKANEF